MNQNLDWQKKEPNLAYNDIVEDIIHINNEVYFTASITPKSICKLINEVNTIIQQNKTNNSSMMSNSNNIININIYIDSPGGSLVPTFKFIDYITIIKRVHNVSITTIGIGMIASAATLIFAAGDKRQLTSNTTCMIHELFSGNSGRYTELISGIKYIKDLHTKIINIYKKSNPNISEEQLNNYLKSESWFTANEYLELGFADEII